MSSFKVNKGGLVFEYGFNSMTKSYGYQIRDLALNRVILSSNTESGLSNIELAEKMKEFGASKEHILKVISNKPI
jgi:hypothetical protein